MRANEEWGLRLEELRLRTEALKRSEAATVQAIADTAEKEEKRHLQKRAEKMEPWRDSDLPEEFEMTNFTSSTYDHFSDVHCVSF